MQDKQHKADDLYLSAHSIFPNNKRVCLLEILMYRLIENSKMQNCMIFPMKGCTLKSIMFINISALEIIKCSRLLLLQILTRVYFNNS